MSDELLQDVEKRLDNLRKELYQEIEKVRIASTTRDETQVKELHEFRLSMHTDLEGVKKSFRNNAWSLVGVLVTIAMASAVYFSNQIDGAEKNINKITVQQAVNTTHIGVNGDHIKSLTGLMKEHKLESNKNYKELEDEIKAIRRAP